MLLIYNTIMDKKFRQYFDQIAVSRLFPGKAFETVHLGEKLPKCNKYTHLLLTGSELSASKGSELDNGIFHLLEEFIKYEKAVYGICHGHQMIARFLSGDKCCRRAIIPEFGFKMMQIKDDRLFRNVKMPIFLESRYDEIIDLPQDFRIIAGNELEAVQAFRYKDLHIWGTQFHPEFLYQDGVDMLKQHLTENPQDKKFYRDDWLGKKYEPESMRIFRNFY